MKNLRPISFLNVVYKLASSVIANRVKQTLQDIIHENQKGFIAGRFIGENIRLICDVLFETKQQNIPGLILSKDFEKAFDTVSSKFISKTLVLILANQLKNGYTFSIKEQKQVFYRMVSCPNSFF